MKKLPSFKQLQYLAALYQHQHFGKAAQACFVTQSTLSAGIAELESVLGLTLLERDHKHFLFTPLALELVDRGKKLLAQASDLVDFAQNHLHPMSGQVILACIPTIAPFVVHPLLKMAKQTYPNLQLLIKEETTEKALQQLEDGVVDVVLLALPKNTTAFKVDILHRDYFSLVIPKHWQEKGCLENKCTWPDECIILLEEVHCLSRHAIEACHIDAQRLIHPFRATSILTLTQLINQGLGVTYLPQSAIASGLLKGTDLIEIPLKQQTAYRDIALVYRKNASREPTFNLLALLIKQFLDNLE